MKRPGGSPKAEPLMKYALSKIPRELEMILPSIDARILPISDIYEHMNATSAVGIHVFKDHKRCWYIAVVPHIIGGQKSYAVLTALMKDPDQEQEYFFQRDFLSALFWCAWSEKSVSHAMTRTVDTMGTWRQRPVTFLISDLPAYVLKNCTWFHTCNIGEMERFYRHLLEQIAASTE